MSDEIPAITRIVTHRDEAGVSHASVEPVAAGTVSSEPGMEFYWIWSTDDAGASVSEPEPASRASFFPTGHGTRAMVTSYPPATVNGATPTASREQLEAWKAESDAIFPGLFGSLDYTDDSGFHATDTIDYMIMLEGELVLELDDGEHVVLRRGSITVQRGTRHRWVNRGDRRAVAAFVMVGATN